MKCLVVDDHALIRDALSDVLRELQPGADVRVAANGAEARALFAAGADIDLVLLDLNLPDDDGLDLLAEWRDDRPATAIVMLSGTCDVNTVRVAMAAGAAGFVSKSDSRKVLSSALALILAGGTYLPPSILTDTGAQKPLAPRSNGDPTPGSLGLTPRQLDVLALILQGRSNKLIARELNLAEPTVKNHVTALLRMIGVASRTEAVIAVTRWGWTLPSPPPPAR